ncbi:MAG: PrsW family intramembrane metalloprotease [Lachnospiraceae bacterium]|nr:PrsW family intramembrane metalloprotease [Lachnospiraceae bacterium]
MILMLAALLPAIVLIAYIYKMDKVEKEPKRLLGQLFFLGALGIVPAAFAENILKKMLGIFAESDTFLYHLVFSFLIVALVEEFWKRAVVKGIAWRNPDFNYRFDAVVYAVTAAMGFAALENLLYVVAGGWKLAVTRAITAVPSHAVDGVFMGYFLGEARLCEKRGDMQGMKRNMRRSFWVPVLCHGFYDFCLFRSTVLSLLLFVVFVVWVDVTAIRRIEKSSRQDLCLEAEEEPRIQV